MFDNLSSVMPSAWNQRILTLDEFYRQSEHDGVIVRELSMEPPGVYLHACNRPIIFLQSELIGWRKSLVAWHEYAHFKLHPHGIRYYHGPRSRAELEADICATCAIIPRAFIAAEMSALQAEFHYSDKLMQYRYWIYYELNL